jgi:hypothetical protein
MRPTYPEPEMVKYRQEIINKLIKDGYRFGAGGSDQCGHCGAHIRYAALMVHTKVKEFIYVGEVCLGSRFDLTKEEFQRVRQAAILKGQLHEKQLRIAQFFEDHPLLVWITYADQIENSFGYVNGFLADLNRKLHQYGEPLSTRQIAAAERSILQDTEREDERRAVKAAEAAEPQVEAPEGRVVVTGEIYTTKWVENDFGGALKMGVKDDRGFRVWCTVPASLPAHTDRGMRVRFTASLKRSVDDQSFAWAKRPTKAALLEVAEES